ncbi:DUF2914 domain-containing protein [candidate division KSB1 bacterium]
MELIQKVKTFPYDRYKKFFPAAAFFSGFTWDSLTLNRIDSVLDNLILAFYLSLLGGMLIVTNLIQREKLSKPILLKYQNWYPFVMQFLLGGLFSAYVVFYFKSATFTQPGLFLFLLVVLLVANEFIEDRLTNIYVQISLYFLVNASFFIFIIPVIFRRMGFLTFLAGGLISMLVVDQLIRLLNRKHVFQSPKEFNYIRSIAPVLLTVLVLFYLCNWIPPVPLSVKTIGIYHSVEKSTAESGLTYVLAYEKPPWYRPWKKSDDVFHYRESDRVYCFSPVFASKYLRAKIYHHWQWYDENEEQWRESDKIEITILGGRDEGYRLYSYKEQLRNGPWRVEVRTGNGALLRRVEFDMVPAEDGEFELTTINR